MTVNIKIHLFISVKDTANTPATIVAQNPLKIADVVDIRSMTL